MPHTILKIPFTLSTISKVSYSAASFLHGMVVEGIWTCLPLLTRSSLTTCSLHFMLQTPQHSAGGDWNVYFISTSGFRHLGFKYLDFNGILLWRRKSVCCSLFCKAKKLLMTLFCTWDQKAWIFVNAINVIMWWLFPTIQCFSNEIDFTLKKNKTKKNTNKKPI